ncbi:MAG: glycosyltransferase [Verrucomicrobiota bacterium]
MGPPMIFAFMALWMTGWILAARFRRPRVTPGPCNPVQTSVIIPARNEAHNLPRLLQSFATQSVTPREILVVDDGSSDNTAAIAREMGATVIPSQPLPDGWRGKTWACHQGALAAQGDRLLFMDADTWLEPGGLQYLLSFPHDGALCVVPYHAVRESYEDLSLFFNLCMTAGTVPRGLAGQILLVSASHYQRVGGHEAVRGRILENFRLAERFRAAGIPLRSLTGKGLVAFRMYPTGLRELVHGWTKGFAAGAGGTPAGTLLLVIAWMAGLLLAPQAGILTGEWLVWGPACLLCSLQVAWVGRKLGKFGWLLMLVYPVPLVFFFGVFGWSAMRSGKNVTWKGREIHAD